MAGVPRWISPEAQHVATVIDRMVEDLLAESGLRRVNRTGATQRSLAALVQWAIDQRLENMQRQAPDA